MAKSQKQHDIGAPEGEHDWFVNSNVFPGGLEGYEFDQPYAVELCACGARRTVMLSDKQVEEVREFNALPSEKIETGDTDKGGEEV